jgi:hypothetical protein
MAHHDNRCITEAVRVATGVEFEAKETVRDRLRQTTRMKVGSIKRTTNTRYLAFSGALLDILPRCIDSKVENGEVERGYYSDQLT